MALHRDIYWIGRQWAVTGFGMQLIDQRHGGKFDIEIARLWDEGLAEADLGAQKWFNPDDFAKGLSVARQRHTKPEAPAQVVSARESPPLETKGFRLQATGSGKFLRPWRIRVKR
jgi:hypothetical protein